MTYQPILQQIAEYQHLQKLDPVARASRIAMNAAVSRIEREALRTKALDEQIQRETILDPIDNRLRAIIAANKNVVPFKEGMAGARQFVDKMFDRNHFKARAAESLLLVRQTRRWHKYHKGVAFTSDMYLQRAASFRIHSSQLKESQ